MAQGLSGHLPAAGGGPPAFARMLPMVRPEGLPETGLQQEALLRELRSILESGRITNGARVQRLEESVAAYLGIGHCVAVSSCTAGLILTLRVLDIRGEVILPTFTFCATAHAVAWNSLRPVFADCDPETWCLTPQTIRSRLTASTAAILPVHLFGNPVEATEVDKLAEGLGIPVIYDAAHAFGSKTAGRYVGGFGLAEVFSFSPTKLLVAGEGGMVATRDAALARRLRAARNYGDAGDYDPQLLGMNARMGEWQAALALHGLPEIEERIERRNRIRERYETRLGSLPGLQFQRVRPSDRSACKDFTLLVDEAVFGQSRDALFRALLMENIEVKRYFWPPVHQQKIYRGLWDGQPLPITERISGSVLSLPIYSSLRDEEVDKVCDAILRVYEFMSRHEAAEALGA